MLHQYRCADAWPLIAPPTNWGNWAAALVVGEDTLAPRMTAVPVPLTYPAASHQGSICENQLELKNRYYDDT